MDIKKFLKDNKGCPLTVPAIKQLLVKFIELLSEKGVVKDKVSNIKELSKETLDELQVGDIVQKITGNQKHAYMVTYKGEGAGEGICLTYCDAGYMETVSYDRSGNDWVYNSTDVVTIPSDDEIKVLAKEAVEATSAGTIQDALGLDDQGNLVKGAVSGGTKLYKHDISWEYAGITHHIYIENNSDAKIENYENIILNVHKIYILSTTSNSKSVRIPVLGIRYYNYNYLLIGINSQLTSNTYNLEQLETFSSGMTFTDTVTEL